MLLLLVEIYNALPFQPLSFLKKFSIPQTCLQSGWAPHTLPNSMIIPAFILLLKLTSLPFHLLMQIWSIFSLSQAKLVTPNSYLVDVNWLLSQATLWQISQCAQWLWQQEWGLGMGSTTSTLPYSGWAGYPHYQLACLPTPEAVLSSDMTPFH